MTAHGWQYTDEQRKTLYYTQLHVHMETATAIELFQEASDEIIMTTKFRGPIYQISYDLSYDYLKFIVRSTYDSDLKRAEISLRGIS